MSAPTFRHRLEYAGFRLARAVLRSLPESWALGAGALLGWVAGAVLRIRRPVVDENLTRAFPDRDEGWRRRVAVASYRHLGREAVATFRLSGEPREVMVAHTEVVGLDALREALADGRGAVVASGHLGNWEVGGAALASRGVPVDAVAFRQRNRLFDRDLVANRERLGMRVIPRGEASRAVFRSLEKGRVAALVADQDAGRRGLFVDFFGVPASTARGPAVFSLRSGAPLFLAIALVLPGRPYRCRLHLEPVAYEPRGDVSTDVRGLVRAQVLALEAWVRDHPEQYFWQHRRWKTRPRPPASDAGDGPASAASGGRAARNRSPPDGL